MPNRPTALVTGGNRGIGLAIAEGLAGRGHRVVIGVRDLAAGQTAAAEIGAEAVLLDLERPESFAPALGRIGGVDILVNNAGILDPTPMLADGDLVRRNMQIMALGPYELIRKVIPHMGAMGWGRIVNMSSGWGSFDEGVQGPGAYGVAKASLNAFTLALSREAPACVKINAMCPGWVRTRMGGAGATRSPEEGAATALWLATLPEDGPTGGFFRDNAPIAW